jgi:sec-independent protein translocase protein TatB
MDFIGIGPLELILILILGFLFFGPEKLPGIAAKAGKLYRNFRKAAFNMSRSITEELSIGDRPEDDKKTVSMQSPTDKVSQANTQITASTPSSNEKPHE